MRDTYQKLLEHYREIIFLQQAQELLGWDQETMMPPKGSQQRAEQLSALEKVIHAKLTDPKIGEYLSELNGAENSELFDPFERADIREIRRAYLRASKVPVKLAGEIAKKSTLSVHKWAECREKGDFKEFWPLFSELLQLKREEADALREGTEKTRYQTLLEDYEPGTPVETLEKLFSQLEDELPKLVSEYSRATAHFFTLRGRFPQEAQKKFCLLILSKLGYDLDAGRLDSSTHPFCSGSGRDVRITTRYSETSLFEGAVLSTVHEAGHALYEQGIKWELIGRPVGQYVSLGIHESQSRLWENFLGRSKPFWEFFIAPLKEYFPQLKELTVEQIWQAVNRVRPSLIRTEADEVTYNLHILLRFEIEEQLIEGKLEVEELPSLWKEKFYRYFGITPKNDKEGAMQDIHWPMGIFGYFPTYTLGNLYAAQFYQKLRSDLPLEQLLREGRFDEILLWLRENIHQNGRLYTAPELCKKVTGSELSTQPLLNYFREKYGEQL